MKLLLLTSALEATDGWGRYALGFFSQAKKRHGEASVTLLGPKDLLSAEARWFQPFRVIVDVIFHFRAARKADLVHALTEPAAPAAMLLAALTGKPYVQSVIGTYSDLRVYPWYLRPLYRWAFGRADGAAILSAYTASRAGRYFNGVHRIVHGGFDPPAAVLARQHWSGKHRILSVGMIKKRKGFHTLVDALGQLHRQGFDFHCDIAGKKPPGAYADSLLRALRNFDIENKVVFHGRVEQAELDRLYDRADLFVLPSEHDGLAFEGLGLVHLEAMARGLPAIGSKRCGSEDIIDDGRNGWLIEPGHAGDLAKTIRKAFEDERRWRGMSEEALETVKSFSWDKVGHDMQALYEDIMERKTNL